MRLSRQDNDDNSPNSFTDAAGNLKPIGDIILPDSKVLSYIGYLTDSASLGRQFGETLAYGLYGTNQEYEESWWEYYRSSSVAATTLALGRVAAGSGPAAPVAFMGAGVVALGGGVISMIEYGAVKDTQIAFRDARYNDRIESAIRTDHASLQYNADLAEFKKNCE